MHVNGVAFTLPQYTLIIRKEWKYLNLKKKLIKIVLLEYNEYYRDSLLYVVWLRSISHNRPYESQGILACD